MKFFLRIILSPLGLVKILANLANKGARDIQNKIRYKGAKIDSGCCLDSLSFIGKHTYLMENTIINNCKIESYTYIGRNCLIQNSTIGKYCSIANDVLIGLGNHPKSFFSTSPLFYRKKNHFKIKVTDFDLEFNEYKDIKIGNDVWLGARSIVLDGIKIGHGAIIAANSVVTKDVPDYAIVGGIPAKVISYRFNELEIQGLLKSEWWNLELNEILKKMPQILSNFK